MKYAVIRMRKVKADDKSGMDAHNRRIGEQQPNVDPSMTRLNHSSSSSIVDAINKRLPAKMRKDAVQSLEFIISASPEFFERLAQGRPRSGDWLRGNPEFMDWVNTSAKWMKHEFGVENVVDVTLHLDETTPHLHVVVVPIVNGRLCAKEITSIKDMYRWQDEYPKAVAKFGLVRGEQRRYTKSEHTTMVEAVQRSRKAPLAAPIPSRDGVSAEDYIKSLEQYANQVKGDLDAVMMAHTIKSPAMAIPPM